ncbi:Integrase, catalytic core protein, partial [Phytophthora megakarya]
MTNKDSTDQPSWWCRIRQHLDRPNLGVYSASIGWCRYPTMATRSAKWANAWQEALDLEYQPLLENGTWKLTKLPIGYKALPCHWVLVVKYNADGSIERFKARLVAQGNHQEFGVNCDEFYAPVAGFEPLRLVL